MKAAKYLVILLMCLIAAGAALAQDAEGGKEEGRGQEMESQGIGKSRGRAKSEKQPFPFSWEEKVRHPQKNFGRRPKPKKKREAKRY